MEKQWYNLKIEETIEKLNTNEEKGLSQAEVEKRQTEFGLNELKESNGYSDVADTDRYRRRFLYG